MFLRSVLKHDAGSRFILLPSCYDPGLPFFQGGAEFSKGRSPFCEPSVTGWPPVSADASRDASYQSLHRLTLSHRNTSLLIDLEGKWLRPIRYHSESGNGVL